MCDDDDDDVDDDVWWLPAAAVAADDVNNDWREKLIWRSSGSTNEPRRGRRSREVEEEKTEPFLREI